MSMTVLAVGDIVGDRAASDLHALLHGGAIPHVDFIVVNGENAAAGRGLTPSLARTILDAGADVITSGNHIWDKIEIKDYIDGTDSVLRPANYPDASPGIGYTIKKVAGWRILVLNVLGVGFMDPPLACPFVITERILRRELQYYDFALIDIHAESTGEKLAFARYFDSLRELKVAAIWGTHTHIPTSDVRILPGGTGFVTDLGMTGPQDGVLGIKTENILTFLRDKMPSRFSVSDGETVLEGVVFTIDEATAQTKKAVRVTASFGA